MITIIHRALGDASKVPANCTAEQLSHAAHRRLTATLLHTGSGQQ
jgi:hypothetical protein